MIRLLMSDRPCGRSANAVSVFLLSCVLVAVPHVGMTQGTPDEPAPAPGSEAGEQQTDEADEAEGEPEPPGASPEQQPKRKNPFKRIGPQPLTEEQREEAERLRK